MLISSLTTVSLLAPRGYQWDHSPWLGVRLYDLIFPVFVTLSGVGLAFANKGRPHLGVTVRRGLTLIVCGLIYNAVAEGSLDISTWRITGPLTAYGFLVFFVGIVHRWVRTWRAWAALTVGWAVVLTWSVSSFQAHCPTGVLTPDCNASRKLDPLIFGVGHIYHQGTLGHDPEGVVAMMGLFLTAFVGITAGHILLASRGSALSALRVLAWLAASLVGGLFAQQLVEPFKRQWTPSFALLTAALGLGLLVVCVVLFDQARSRAAVACGSVVAWPLVALGRNSLLMYFGSHAFVELVSRTDGALNPTHIARRIDWTVLGRHDAGFIILNVGAWWALALVLHHYGIYITAGGINRTKSQPRPLPPAEPPAVEQRQREASGTAPTPP